ncbi:MAG: phasin family protein [Gammaproteobacteria bacterium]
MHDANTGFYRQVFETQEGVMAFALEVNDILSRTQERIVQQRSTTIEAWLEAARSEWQALADAKHPMDFLFLQVDVAADLSERVLANIQELIDIQLQVRNDILQCLQKACVLNTALSSWAH